MSDFRFSILMLLILVLVFCSCERPIPKPNAMLRLEYPEAHYHRIKTDCPYDFQKNDYAVLKPVEECQWQIEYPNMKATVHLTYRQVTNNIDSLLRDAQKLTYEHVVKADDIMEQPFINKDQKVYGMFYEVGGDAASQSQFYITDSTNHFLTGALYFYAKPNYDSILPAVAYVNEDIRTLMESLKWKD